MISHLRFEEPTWYIHYDSEKWRWPCPWCMFQTLQFLQPLTCWALAVPTQVDVWRAVNLTAICMKTIQMRTATQFVLWGRNFIQFEHATSFTLHMICSRTWTRSTPNYTPISRDRRRGWGLLVCKGHWRLSCQCLGWMNRYPRHLEREADGFSLDVLVWKGAWIHFRFCRAHLPKVGFVKSTDEFAFSFVDPANVIHGCHLVPAFHEGCTIDLLPVPQKVSQCLYLGDDDDWVLCQHVSNFVWWYLLLVLLCWLLMVLSFVDRDMVMHYFKGWIGHLDNSTWHQVNCEPPDTKLEELEEEMEISDDGGNNASDPGEASLAKDIIMNYKVYWWGLKWGDYHRSWELGWRWLWLILAVQKLIFHCPKHS